MKKYEQNSRVMVGALLKRAKLESGSVHREIAIELGLRNPNFLSMIESGRYAVPKKRLIDVGVAYRLPRLEILAIVKLTAPDLWETVGCCTQLIGMAKDQWEELGVKIDEVIGSVACEQAM